MNTIAEDMGWVEKSEILIVIRGMMAASCFIWILYTLWDFTNRPMKNGQWNNMKGALIDQWDFISSLGLW